MAKKSMQILVEPEEHKLLKLAATEINKTLSDFIRDLAIPKAEKILGGKYDNRNTIKH